MKKPVSHAGSGQEKEKGGRKKQSELIEVERMQRVVELIPESGWLSEKSRKPLCFIRDIGLTDVYVIELMQVTGYCVKKPGFTVVKVPPSHQPKSVCLGAAGDLTKLSSGVKYVQKQKGIRKEKVFGLFAKHFSKHKMQM